MNPKNLKYTKDHEWIDIHGEEATVGITHFAQKELGDIVYVEVESLDEFVDSGKVFGTVEAVKTVSDLFMPISGKVIRINQNLIDNPELINMDPYGKGWLIKIKISNLNEVINLLDSRSYEKITG